MPLWLAVVLLLLSLPGIFFSRRLQNKPLRILCIIFFVLLALASGAYIGLTLLLVNAVQHQPPAA